MSKLSSIFSRGSYVCPFCGNKLKKSEMFCPGCGQPRVEEEQAQPDYGYAAPAAEPAFAAPEYAAPAHTGPVCHACGNPMEEGDRFCMNCGARREDAPAAPEDAAPIGFAQAAPFEDDAPAFAPEPFVPRPETTVPVPETFEPKPETTIFMTDDEEAEAPEPAAEEAADDVSADSSESFTMFDELDEAAIWGRPAQEPDVPTETVAEDSVEEAPANADDTVEAQPVAEDIAAEEIIAVSDMAGEPVSEEAAPAADVAAAAPIYTDSTVAARPAVTPVKAETYGLKFLAEPTRDVCILHSGAMIGRMAGCTLVIDEPSISRRHCHIDLIDNVWKLIVLGVNGIVIDGDHFSNEYGRPIELTDGSIIEFPGIGGNIAVKFIENPF